MKRNMGYSSSVIGQKRHYESRSEPLLSHMPVFTKNGIPSEHELP